MMKKLNLIGWAILSLTITFVLNSCEDDDNPSPTGVYTNGVFIVNEGNSTSGGSVSFYSYQGDTVSNNIFEKINQRPLGTFVQSLAVFDNKTYIVVNGSNKVEVVERHNFKEVATITGFDMPRYFIPVTNDKAYVTQWGNEGQVKVIDLQNNEISNTIDVGNGPEKMYSYYNKIYVANGGGLDVDSTIFVIDAMTDQVIDTIEVGHNPKDMVIDIDLNLWVLCYGYVQYGEDWSIVSESPSELYKINTNDHSIINSYKISDNLHPGHLEISPDGKSIYYGAGFSFGNIYKMNIYDSELPANPFSDKYFYGFNVDWTDGTIFALEAPDFTSNGFLYRIHPDGTILGNYEVGIGPNSIGMKKK
jgi:YVTN family beta-propeller protein